MANTCSEGYDFVSSFYNANLGMDVKEILGPAFPTGFLSTQWLFVLQIKKDFTYINLRREEHCGPDEAVHVILKDRAFQNVWRVNETEPLARSFNKGDTVEIMKVKNHLTRFHTLMRTVTNPKRDVVTVRCNLTPDFQKYYHMYELSNNMCSLFTNPKFSDCLLCIDECSREAHRAILSVRTPKLKISGKREFDADAPKIKLPSLTENVIEHLSKFAYSAQMEPNLKYPEDRVLNRTARYLGISNFEENTRDVSYSKSVTNLKFKRSYINASCDYSKLAGKSEQQKFDFVAYRMRWTIQCLFAKTGDEKDKTMIKVSCNSLGAFETLTLRYFVFVACSCSKLMTTNLIYRNVQTSKKRFLLTDYCKNVNKCECCTIRSFHFYIDIWAGNTEDLVEQGKPRYMRDNLADILDLSEDLEKLFYEESYSDATIKVPDGDVKVHRAILSARSPVFERMFDIDMIESTDGEIHVVDFEKDVMTKLLKYIYTARVSFLENVETIQLAYAADKYEIISLKDKCLNHLSDNTDKDSALDIYTLFDRLQAEDELRNKVLKYIQEYFCAVCNKNELENWKLLNPQQYFNMFKRTCSCVL